VGRIPSAKIFLEANREYLQRNYLDLWAGAYCLSGEEEALADVDDDDDDDPFDNGEPFGEETEDEPGYSSSLLGYMRNIYEEDLYIQQRVEEFSADFAKDDTELFDGITGRELIEHMREHLPDPDPRALEAYRKKRGSNAIEGSRASEPKRHGGGHADHRPTDMGQETEGTSGNLWLVVALFALIGGGAVLLFSKARQS